MRCPECGKDTNIIDSRKSWKPKKYTSHGHIPLAVLDKVKGDFTFRKHECSSGHRFATVEQIIEY